MDEAGANVTASIFGEQDRAAGEGRLDCGDSTVNRHVDETKGAMQWGQISCPPGTSWAQASQQRLKSLLLR